MSFQVLLFYKYVTVEDPQAFAAWVRARAEEKGLTGRVIIAEEGINATLEGETSQTERMAQELRADPRFADMNIKRSVGTGTSFPDLSVKVRRELVGTRFSQADADPRVRTAPHLPPEELRAMYERNDDFVVVDMRNSFEFVSGHFKNSVDPGMRASRDLKDVIVKLEKYKDKKIVTVCTGGIRCEKMSAYLLSKGFKNVHQLENGIHAYMEKYPGKDFLGTLYTFDERVDMHFGGEREIVGSCHLCQAKTERYTHCKNDDCHLHMLVCEDCGKTTSLITCSRGCRLRASFLQQKKQGKRALERSRVRLRRYKRILVGRTRSFIWGIRTGQLFE